ncbi:MAG: M48 family metallopeptidase [Armatimonadota bacterium]
MYKMLRWLLLAVVVAGIPWLLGAEGCGGGTNVTGIDEPTEIRIGQQSAREIEDQYGVVTNTKEATRVDRIGRSIAAVTQRPQLPWSFNITNQKEANAFALPGGPVYVTRGLIEMGLSDAELAGVLGHETAHINQRHSVKAIQRAMTYQLLSDLVIGQNETAMRTAVNLAVQYGSQLPHSRQDEYEADSVGLRLAYNAGYSANGLVSFLKKLDSVSGKSNPPEWLSTHPLTKERVTRADSLSNTIAQKKRPVSLTISDTEISNLGNTDSVSGGNNTYDWPSWTNAETKIVPILSVGTPGVSIGFAQVTGPAERVNKVRAVLQLDATFKSIGRVKAFVPSDSYTDLRRVQGTAVTALLQYNAMKF